MTTSSQVPNELLLIGEIVAPFGVRGQVKVRSYTDRVEHLQRRIRFVYLSPEWQQVPLKNVVGHKPGLLIMTLSGVTKREQAEELRGTEVAIREQEAAPLEEDEYFLHQLYGLTVVNEAGETLGRVREVMETGANDVLVVQREGQSDALIPMIRDVVQELDVANSRIVIRPLEGLL